ncbi:MAG: NADH-quinone oxidoreductase subunit N [Nitrospinae bacterium RIFCSPLOWO2_02_FULL_39_110]|nr:MAG: NADH-quinone oxidoreductase subunit N [Nitrospinae bacterium RIFCSPHIGHO2_02_39_11]OGV97747.1 MAG: NADH-quinone oxidoreductase subunit N [Nitrospinae bacterium RIFCSPHIGHO2_12_FULL_39_42]OGW02105.1 MAG: NADH-quinone oxidoreductase subunit N [Nitrospinae bacterium RIFCSPLOWO2_02_39_17]OGW02340.1 MAG: NADH-quinone oxidoreductase subunit N [Nitrospinae bacterium RIFCSPHIGHO2_02_FULL_39_82]OGW07378.1 MAG: NADH-quinone oxidoreductase subunit N [Nitrospinae bacterium RIFCSPLOWO2_02_FULL_39_11
MEILIPTIKLATIYPEIIITTFAILVLLLQVFPTVIGKDYLGYTSLAGVILAAIITGQGGASGEGGEAIYSFSNMWVVDNYSRFFKLIFLLGTGLTILISIKYTKDEGINNGEYYSLLLFATAGMMLMAGGTDLIVIFLGLELMSISLYVLAGYVRKRLISNESALKYFLLGSFATGFLLYGIALLYGATGTTSLKGISGFISEASFGSPILIMGMLLLLIGFGFKIAAVPFHMWTPDVYEGAPSPITAFMSAGPKAAAFAAFLRVFIEALPSLQGIWVDIIWVLAALTMTIGNVIALVQDNVKRMLAYSSIAHAGYVLVAFVSTDKLGVASILYYMLAYTFMNIGAFAIVIIIGGKGEEKINLKDYTGLAYRYPLTAAAMCLFLLSLTGIPPTAGFMGKLYIFSAAIKSGYVGLATIAVLNSVISVYYYMKIILAMYMKEPESSVQHSPLVFTPAMIIALGLAVYGVLRMGIFPSAYISMAQQSYLSF